MSVYRARSIKRHRRTKAEIEAIKKVIVAVVHQEHPMTVRQVFYRLVSMGAISKTEAEYKTTVCRLLTELRRSGDIPYGFIADNTRWMRKPRTYSGLESALEQTAQFYRRDLWDDLDERVEIWLEKDALAGVVYEVTEAWHVPLMVTRGYPSLSYLHSAAEVIEDNHRYTTIYYFGDHDPSGKDIPRFVQEGINEMLVSINLQNLTNFSMWSGLGDDSFDFEIVAVTTDQIEEWDLPTRPTKRTDSRAKNFEGDSVELDAIPPDKLRELVETCITQHIPEGHREQIEKVERVERETLEKIAEAGFPTGDAR